ncbi:hypothetical protein O181_059316 [Austropuccinia psidii MF-1]|uniref:Bromodomain associated domain-containing protein n=1 Tax=Austropuccinia psidii MF-1 TaxID=1389203 RepID=A0A9Q3EBZ8_9BASI|nr:hypothetical protein [Austropuccinia psidii MF-1]
MKAIDGVDGAHRPSPDPCSSPRCPASLQESTARFALLRLISIQLSAVGFTHVQNKSLLADIEGLVCALIDGLVRLAAAMGQHSRRSKPNIRDLLAACEDQGIQVKHLLQILSNPLPHHTDFDFELPLAPTTSAGDPTLSFLPSDSESDDGDPTGNIQIKKQKDSSATELCSKKLKRSDPERIGGLPHLPHLPANHTWKYTTLTPPSATVLPPEHLARPILPAPPTSNCLNFDFLQVDEDDPNTPACLGLLNRRIRDARLVERSLTNLVQPNLIFPGRLQMPKPNSDGSPQKLKISESDVPITNFEGD